jgi:hypothetical protein
VFLASSHSNRIIVVYIHIAYMQARVGWVEAIAETHHNPHRRMSGVGEAISNILGDRIMIQRPLSLT